MNAISRIGDIGVGICCCHPPIPCIGMAGIIVTFSSDVIVNNRGAGRVGDIVLGGCGHVGVLVNGSSLSITNERSQAFVGSVFAGCFTGVIVSGSGDVFSK